jgi:hypothetical protein
MICRDGVYLVNKMWALVDLSRRNKLITTQWVYKIKLTLGRKPNKLRTRLMA